MYYMQSFLLGGPEILVGFQTPAGQVTTTQVFKTVEIPRLVHGKLHAWDPAACLRVLPSRESSLINSAKAPGHYLSTWFDLGG
ncbi:hypothetical protein FB451DRAFT_1440816 [Mycena latifolia]|nr:hypothetical protein FB451DRAFT_1440816 [Mycena latifolia]